MNPKRQKTDHSAQCLHNINSAYPLPLPIPHILINSCKPVAVVDAVAKKQRQIFDGKGPFANAIGPTSNAHTQENCRLLCWGFVVTCGPILLHHLRFQSTISIFTPAGGGSRIPQSSPNQSPVDKKRLKPITNR